MTEDNAGHSRDVRGAQLSEQGCPGTTFKALRAPVGIRAGKQVANHVGDQKVLMDMLDNLSNEFGGNRNRSTGTLEVSWPKPAQGKCHVNLWTMILRVQNYFYVSGGKLPGELGFKPDGVVDPGGRTEALIRAYSSESRRPLRPLQGD